MTTSALMKSILHNSIADGLYNEVVTRNSRYYYYLGKTVTWTDDLTPPYPTDSLAYEFSSRNDIITMKEIKPTDIAYVIPRYNWTSGTIYDQYDDQYSTEVQGVNLTAGGTGYGSDPFVYIGSQGSVNWAASTSYVLGKLIKSGNNYYIVTTTGVTGTTAPTHTTGTVTNGTAPLQWVSVSNGGGTGATATSTRVEGSVAGITLTARGSGYTSIPTCIIAGGGTGAAASAVVTISPNGFQKLENALFYVVTDEFNVYKCLDNNSNGVSTIKPTSATVDPIVLSDGYMWKFMYNVPIALRNKFLTDDYIPVVTALRNQFYSSGQLQTIRVDAGGSGYTSGAITVQGDGNIQADPIYLTGITLTSGGSAYVSPTVSIDPPFTGVAAWQASTLVLTGQKLSFNNNIYEVAVSGTTTTTGPTHRFGIIANGSAALKYVGTQAIATATINGSGTVTALTLYGLLRTIQVLTGGSGYTSTPAITVGTLWTASTALTLNSQVYYANNLYTVTTAGTTHASTPPSHTTGAVANGTATLTWVGYPATAKALLSVTSIIRFDVTDPGLGYTSAPTINIGTQWTATTAVTIGQQIYFSNRLYTVTVDGTTGSVAPVHLSGATINSAAFAFSTALTLNSTVYVASRLYKVTTAGTTSAGTTPTHTTGTVTNGTADLLYLGTPATLTYVGVQATATSTIKFGAGYSSKPTVTVSGAPGAGANITFTSEDSAARLIPIFDNGQLATVQIDDAGVGYTFANLNVTGDGTGALISADLSPGDVNTLQATIELLTVDGRIMNIPIISGGWGYGGTPTVTITGDGTGAVATATVSNGAVTKLTMTAYGSGYRYATVVISGTGYGAKARAIISPYGGHAKEALNNFYARTLMFYSNISQDKNQGFDVNNDYRQLGIIKNPRQYGSNNSLTSILASACWVISGTANTTLFPADSIITKTSGSTRFRIVTNTGTAMLVQAIDNATAAIGNNFTNAAGDVFTATAVTAPTADKYSGDLMFIDNRAAFTPTADQTVTLRTVIRF